MLPGLRFLFAATLMCFSALVFGMGAIALLRASHQQFASAPPRLPPEPVFAQAPQTVPAPPTLSLLRIEPAPPPAPLGEIAAKNEIAALTGADRALQHSSAPLGDSEVPPDDPRSDATPPPAAEGSPATQATVEPSVQTPAAEPNAPATETSVAEAPASAPAPDVTGTVAPPETVAAPPEAVPPSTPPVIDPPLPMTRPQIAALPPPAEAAKTPVTKPAIRPAVKRKARNVRREPPKTERLPAVTSAPTLGSLFGGGN